MMMSDDYGSLMKRMRDAGEAQIVED